MAGCGAVCYRAETAGVAVSTAASTQVFARRAEGRRQVGRVAGSPGAGRAGVGTGGALGHHERADHGGLKLD